MDPYKVAIVGTSTLAELNLQIEGEEGGASKFVDSTIGMDHGVLSNIVTFDRLAPGTVPPQLAILTQGDTPPSGKSKVWSGVMVLDGTTHAVIGYRQTS